MKVNGRTINLIFETIGWPLKKDLILFSEVNLFWQPMKKRLTAKDYFSRDKCRIQHFTMHKVEGGGGGGLNVSALKVLFYFHEKMVILWKKVL